jgi:hypothetical protein
MKSNWRLALRWLIIIACLSTFIAHQIILSKYILPWPYKYKGLMPSLLKFLFGRAGLRVRTPPIRRSRVDLLPTGAATLRLEYRPGAHVEARLIRRARRLLRMSLRAFDESGDSIGTPTISL